MGQTKAHVLHTLDGVDVTGNGTAGRFHHAQPIRLGTLMTALRISTCPSRVRAAATAAVVGVSFTLAAPIAHADDIPIRSRVDAVRSGSACPALNYRDDLAGSAYAFARGGTVPTNGYPGRVVGFKGVGDPAAAATDHAVAGSDGAGTRNAITDCKYQDFGVSLFRNVDLKYDIVAIVLGQPNQKPVPIGDLFGGGGGPPPKRTVEPPQPGSACGAACQGTAKPTGTPTATVTSDVDVYDVPGGGGKIIGILRQGDVVKVVKACPSDDWCALADGRFAYGQFFKNN
jgi:hypothetical protein